MNSDSAVATGAWVLEATSWLSELPASGGQPVLFDLARDWESLHPPLYRQDWEWIRAELKQIRKRLGNQASRLLRAYLISLDAAAAQGASIGRWDPVVGGEALLAVRRRARRLRGRALRNDVLTAAWDDLLEAVRNPATPPDTVRWRRDLLAATVTAHGISWADRAQLARGVLSDRMWDVKRAFSILGRPHAEFQASDLDIPSGLSDSKRIALALEVLQVSEGPASHVVWLAFDNARINSFPSLDVGRIQFYWAGWLRDKLANNPDGLPPELNLESPLVRHSAIPDLQDGVMARVEVPDTVRQPIEWASRYARSVVSLARFNSSLVGEDVWIALDGTLHARNGSMYSTSTFRRPIEYEPGRDMFFAPSIALGKLAKPLTRADPAAVAEVATSIGWLEAAIRSEPAAAVLSGIRVVEMLAQRSGSRKWYEYLHTHYAQSWIEAEIKSELAHNVRYALRGQYGIPEGMDPQDEVRLRQLSQKVIRHEDAVGHMIRLEPAMTVLPEIIRIYGEWTGLGRTLRWLEAKLSTQAALLDWCTELADDWQLSLLRARWVRNRVAHGPGASPSVTAAASNFAVQMARWVTHVSVEGMVKGRSMQTASARLMTSARKWHSRVATGGVGPALRS